MLVHVTDNNVRVSGRERKKRKDIYIFPCSIKTVNDIKKKRFKKFNLWCGRRKINLLKFRSGCAKLGLMK